MTCSAIAFTNSKYDAVIDTSPITQPLTNFTDYVLTMTLSTNASIFHEFTSANGLTVTATSITVNISDTDITVSGDYYQKLQAKASGQDVFFTICEGSIMTFYDFV